MARSLIYFCGPCLDYGAHPEPAVVRAFDSECHQLAVIRSRDTLSPNASRSWIFNGYSTQGHPVEVSNPSLLYPFPIAFRPTRCAVDRSGRIYAAAGPTLAQDGRLIGCTYPGDWITESSVLQNEWLRVFRHNGDRVPFPQLHGAQIRSILIADDGCIYVGGEEHYLDRCHIRKYSAEGALIWSVEADSHGHSFSQPRPREIIEKMLLDGDGNLYALGYVGAGSEGGVDSYITFIASYDSGGDRRWKIDTVQRETGDALHTWHDMALSEDGAILYTSSSIYTRSKPIIDAHDTDTGDIVYSSPAALSGDPLSRCDIVVSGGVLHAFVANVESFTYWSSHVAYSLSDLSIVDDAETWGSSYSRYPGSPPPGMSRVGNGVGVDDEGNFYFGIQQSTTGGLSGLTSLDDSGANRWSDKPLLIVNEWSDLWNFGFPEHDPNRPGRLSARQFVTVVHEPPWASMALPIGLGAFDTIGDTYTHPPGIALALSIAAPQIRREYVGALRLPDVYRATLTGDTDAELPISSIQIRRNTTKSTMTLTIPSATPEILAAIQDRADGDLVLWRGVRFTDGVEQLEPMLRGPISDPRIDRGSASGSVTLTAQIPATPDAPRARMIVGISYRAVTSGKRRVRGAIDGFIAPGDTAVIGGESFVVGDIVYSITPTAGTMELSEL